MSVVGPRRHRSADRVAQPGRAEPESAGRAEVDTPVPLGNADCPWDLFDSDSYLRNNYSSLHDLDRVIIARLAEFFQSKARDRNRWRGVDVGSGTNLYPALAMLPLTESIDLWEHSQPNVTWLRHGIRPYGEVWDPFWDALVGSAETYRRFDRHERPRALLAARARVEKANIFHLPEARWDIGTMFFVAESITGVRAEFELATEKFVRSLKPGAPFVAAFVRDSRGYQVGGQRFPAVAVTEADLEGLLKRVASGVEIHPVGSADRFREGYDGMILVTGTRDHDGGPRRRGRRRGSG